MSICHECRDDLRSFGKKLSHCVFCGKKLQLIEQGLLGCPSCG
jgi:hypothetical protein